MMDRNLFLNILGSVIQEHPEWTIDAFRAIQYGLDQALIAERQKASDLAYAMSILVNKHPKTVERELEHMQQGMDVLCDFFATSQFGDEIARFRSDTAEGK